MGTSNQTQYATEGWRSASTLVTVITFKRPVYLQQLLESVISATRDTNADILVVDNDAARSAEGVTADLGIGYQCEPSPGIPAARNRVLDSVKSEHDFLVFLDDDEFVPASWYQELLTYALTTGADVVSGPAHPHYNEATPTWLIREGFWTAERLSTGMTLDHVATNNTLVRADLLRANPSIRFDESLRDFGGSDTEFFRQLAPHAGAYLFCSEAHVYEHIPPHRATRKWLFRRAMRIGNVNAKYHQGSGIPLIIGGLTRIAVGTVAYITARVMKRGRPATFFNMVAHGCGMIGSASGRRVREYARVEGRA